MALFKPIQHIKAEFLLKYIEVGTLKRLLNDLDDDLLLFPNPVGNFTVHEPNGELKAWIDFNEEKINPLK